MCRIEGFFAYLPIFRYAYPKVCKIVGLLKEDCILFLGTCTSASRRFRGNLTLCLTLQTLHEGKMQRGMHHHISRCEASFLQVTLPALVHRVREPLGGVVGPGSVADPHQALNQGQVVEEAWHAWHRGIEASRRRPRIGSTDPGHGSLEHISFPAYWWFGAVAGLTRGSRFPSPGVQKIKSSSKSKQPTKGI